LGAIHLIKPHKVDSAHLSAEHLKHSALSIAGPLSGLFTAVLRHGYMPKCIRDCTLVPIPKNNKDPSSSKNYRAIAIASLFSATACSDGVCPCGVLLAGGSLACHQYKQAHVQDRGHSYFIGTLIASTGENSNKPALKVLLRHQR